MIQDCCQRITGPTASTRTVADCRQFSSHRPTFRNWTVSSAVLALREFGLTGVQLTDSDCQWLSREGGRYGSADVSPTSRFADRRDMCEHADDGALLTSCDRQQ